MKTHYLASLLVLAASMGTAQAQTPAATRATTAPAKAAKTANQRAATYQGPKVLKDTKALGQKMVKKSKPADMITPAPTRMK
jgi:hypothetical protein